jgi:serine protease Do
VIRRRRSPRPPALAARHRPGGGSAAAGLAVACLLAALHATAGEAAAQQPQQPAVQAPVQVQQAVDASRRTALVNAAERVAPAVVSVSVTRREAARPRTIWEGFFLGPGAMQEVEGLGSGFLIRRDGLVLTNEHVVRGAERVVVMLADGREFQAEVVGTDEDTDLALLRLRLPAGGATLPVVPLGSSADLLIGEWVVAIGNPFGFLLANSEPTVTAGVVSGVGRNIVGDGQSGYYLDMIQTDASINPGNSGGPLVNALGEVVGVNASILSESGGSQGLGFAIPINRARRVANQLLAHGRVRKGWIGVEVERVVTSASGQTRSIRVGYVAPGSPAAAAGVRAGQVVRRVGPRPVRSPLEWEAALLDAQAGEALELVVVEGARERTFRLTPVEPPSLTAERVRALADFELVTLTPAIRSERGLLGEAGALIVGISPGGQRVGLREGDLILQINRQPIRTAEEAARLLQRLAGRGQVRVVFEREGQALSTSFSISG